MANRTPGRIPYYDLHMGIGSSSNMLDKNPFYHNEEQSGSVNPPVSGSLLLESGFAILLESGGQILLE